jgi:hypothetical protein
MTEAINALKDALSGFASDQRNFGKLEGKVDALEGQQLRFENNVNVRMAKFEEQLREGFRQSQLDREAGNKTLGEMITKVRDDTVGTLQTISATINQGKGMLTIGNALLIASVTIVAALIASGIVIHFH